MSTRTWVLVSCIVGSMAASAAGQALDWELVADSGFGKANNTDARSLATLNGYLFVGTRNDNEGAELWTSWDSGATWEWASRYGFGDVNNNSILTMATFSGYVFAGTWNNPTGAEMWRRAVPGSPTQVNTDGFGAVSNEVVTAMAEFNGYLYAGLWNNVGTGGEVWRSSNGTTWTQCNTDGFGDVNNRAAEAMAVFGGYLYAGTYNSATGTEIWRTSNGTSWSQVGANGLGNSANVSTGAMAFFSSENKLWLGTQNSNGVQVWWTSNGTTFYQFGTIFGSTDVYSMAEFDRGLFIAGNGGSGGAVWRKRQTTFDQVNLSGFGDSGNSEVQSLLVADGVLYAGTRNVAGCEVWRLPLVYSDDFESGDTSQWSAVTP